MGGRVSTKVAIGGRRHQGPPQPPPPPPPRNLPPPPSSQVQARQRARPSMRRPPQTVPQSRTTFSDLMGRDLVEDEEVKSSGLTTASFSEIMGDMLRGKAPLPKEITGHARF